MTTIQLKTNQHRLIANLRHAFNQSSMLGELLQNARRAHASYIDIRADHDSITVSDDGTGIADLQTLLFIAESGWDKELQARENAFGMGVLSTLYFTEHLSVHSGPLAFGASTAAIIRGEAIEVQAQIPRVGTEVRLDGVKPPDAGSSLTAWAGSELQRLCEAFPVRVWFNGEELPRPLARSDLAWRETPVGRVLIDLACARHYWRGFLQGLPIGQHEPGSHQHIVLLRDDMIARLPDRRHLLNEDEDRKRIQSAIDTAYRQTLVEAKERLAGSEFMLLYGETCLSSLNADLLNDIPFALRAWFRNWGEEPAGFVRYWERCAREGISAQVALQEAGVWRLEDDDEDEGTLAAQSYLQARDAFLLREHRLDPGHWLLTIARVITPGQVSVQYQTMLHSQAYPPLADYAVARLTLVNTLHLSLEGDPGDYTVDAVRRQDTLYLTPAAGSPTHLVSDYIFDDRYDEDREDEDERYLATFIAVGCSGDPGQAVNALLPPALRYDAQPKLAGATVRLVFDENGKLASVTSG